MCSFQTFLNRLRNGSDIITMSSGRASRASSPLLPKAKDKCFHYYEMIVRPCLAEFFGVCLFVFVGSLSMQDGLGIETITIPFEPSPMAIALTHGLAVTVLMMSLGAISGGHFNPAITLGVVLSGGISPVLGLGYFISQILGGMCGAGFCRAVLRDEVFEKIKGGAHLLPYDDPGAAILCETITTTILVLTVLLVAVDDRTKTQFCPLAVGFAVSVGVLASVHTTGGSMNPARSFGPALVVSATTNTNAFKHHYVYWVGPVLGGLLAALLYRLLLASANKRLILKER